MLHPEAKKHLAEKARAEWSDRILLNWRRQKTKEQKPKWSLSAVHDLSLTGKIQIDNKLRMCILLV